jgi:hypothetical protein
MAGIKKTRNGAQTMKFDYINMMKFDENGHIFVIGRANFDQPKTFTEKTFQKFVKTDPSFSVKAGDTVVAWIENDDVFWGFMFPAIETK